MKTIRIPFEKYTNQQLVDWIIEKSHMSSNPYENNSLLDAKDELIKRLNDKNDTH